jgi:hypothetical protein
MKLGKKEITFLVLDDFVALVSPCRVKPLVEHAQSLVELLLVHQLTHSGPVLEQAVVAATVNRILMIKG